MRCLQKSSAVVTTVSQQFCYEKSLPPSRNTVFRGCKAFFRMWKRVVFKPGQQAVGGRADHVELRVMQMHVDEARRDQPARKVFDLQLPS